METSASLLERLRCSPQQGDWSQLVDLYTPLIRVWMRRHSSAQQNEDDVVQEVLSVVVRKVPAFERQRVGSFRNWLRSITVNCLRDAWRADRFRPSAVGGSDFQHVLDQMADPDSQLSQLWNQEHDQHVLQYLLQQVRPSLPEDTWQAFRRVAVEGHAPVQVAEDMGISVNSVYIAKSRVMSRIRELGRGLLD